MKNRYKFPILVAAAFFATSCSDFLEQSAQDLIIPKTVEHYKETLQGEGYFKDIVSYSYFLHFMTDDMEVGDFSALAPDGYTDDAMEELCDCYRWAREIENTLFTDNLYGYLYKQVLAANVCISALDNDEMTGTDREKAILRGQSCFQRAYAYFWLANVYAQAFNEAQPSDLCVPLNLSATGEIGGYKRATMAEVWGQMASDIKVAVNSLEGYNTTAYEINYQGALVLASRIALFMGDFEKVEEYGQQLFKVNSRLYDLSVIPQQIAATTQSSYYPGVDFIIDTGKSFMNFMNLANNPEITFNFSPESSTDPYNNSMLGQTSTYMACAQGFRVSGPLPTSTGNTLIEAYQTGDARLNYWFEWPISKYDADAEFQYVYLFQMFIPLCYNYIAIKYDPYDASGTYQFALRTAEVYLNMAEAYTCQSTPDMEESLKYLNTLRRNRIVDYVDLTAADFPSAEDLKKFIWEERRRELCFDEAFRWWDLRREGQPALKHNYLGGETYVLNDHDAAYVLNFPIAEREFDTGLVVNQRPDRVAQ